MALRSGTRILTGLRLGVENILIVVFVIMMTSVLVQVGGRYVRGFTFVGTEEVANFCQVWLVLLGTGVAMRYGRHAMVDIVVINLPLVFARLLYILIAAGSLWFLYIVFVGSIALVDMGFFERSPSLGLPMWTIYISLNIGAAYFAFETAIWIIERWKDPGRKHLTRED